MKKIQYLSYIFPPDLILPKYFRTDESMFFIKFSCSVVILQNPQKHFIESALF